MIFTSLISALGGVLLVISLGGFDPASSSSLLLPAFAAAFLGTAVIEPGRFNPIGSVVAIYFLVTVITGLELIGVSDWVNDVFYGGVLIGAVAITRWVRRGI